MPDSIQNILKPDETVLWSGKPAAAWGKVEMAIVLLSLLLLIFSMTLTYLAEFKTGLSWFNAGLWPILLAVFAFMRNHNFRKATNFLITDHRVLIVVDFSGIIEVVDQPYANISVIQIGQWSKWNDTIYFGDRKLLTIKNILRSGLSFENLVLKSTRRSDTSLPPFFTIENTDKVYELLLQQKDQALAGC